MARAKGTATDTAPRKRAGKHAAADKAAAAGLRANEGRSSASEQVPTFSDATTGRDIAGVIMAVIAVASFIAVVSPATAPVSRAVAGFYHLGFGLGAYVLPFVLLAAAVALFVPERIHPDGRTVAGVVIIYVAISALLSLFVPGANQSVAAMFEAAALSASGGYVGAWVASALQSAVGTTIAAVVLVGAIAAGLVLVGLSIGGAVQSVVTRLRGLAERRHVDVNDAPWGDEDALGGAAAAQPARSRRKAAGGLLDDAGAAVTTFLGNRETTVLSREADDEPDVDEDPFVDVSEQVAAERAETTLIPVPDRVAPAAACAPTTVLSQAPAAGAKGTDTADTAAEDDPEVPPFDTDGKASPTPAIPGFLAGHAQPGTNAAQAAAAELAAAASADAADEDGDAVEAAQLPPASMLRHNPHSAASASSDNELEQTAQALQSTLAEFGRSARVVGWIAGPTVTTFKLQPGEGERVSKISSLEDDIALSLAAQSVRIFAPIPGTSLVGIEIPNAKRQNVNLGDVLPYVQGGPLELAVGRDAEGQPIVADLAKMPHLLIAGTTGSGKSVMINSIIMALLMRTHPDDVRLIMVDPKRVELSGYNGLPHLYVPVVTEPKQAASALQWAVSEMERRLKVFERIGVRKISTFNDKQAAGAFEHYDNPPAKMPYLVIIIDELSDLMMVAGKDVEASIVRIAQLGRAAGIHLIVATQRPSSNVVTGLIKANITNRIAFNVATGIDSRVIIDQMGAEKLTGYGDMLFSKVDWGKPKRIQGCFVSDDEINEVVEFVKSQGAPDYHEEILSAVAPAQMGGGGGGFYNEAPSEDDPLLWDAAQIVVETQLGSTSGLQRRLKVGYARAGRIMDMLEEKGIVGPPDGSKPREVLYDEEGLAALRAVEEPLSDEEIQGGF